MKAIFFGLFLMLGFSVVGEELKVVNVCDLKNEEFMQIMREENSTVVEFSRGMRLPVSLFLEGNLVNFTSNSHNLGEVEVLQSFYARKVGGELLLSVDLNDWKSLFEFITGITSVEMKMLEGVPMISIGSEVFRR